MNRKDFLDMIVYQVYPRSFQDSNGDGIGDLKGLKSRLDYLLALGVNAVWLCPCYKSPNYDNGYDISDYRAIAQDFGSLEDWKDLIADMHERGMKLIMDLVVNHTSSQHFWFEQARSSRDNPYHDYYIWAEKPLTNWSSVFRGSAWEYNEATKEYYLHSFAIQQPDLNWENPKVRQEACDIVDFWVDLGVDGFRCDVLDFISKDFENNKMHNGPRLHEYINQLFGREKVKDIFTIGECQSDEKSIADICGENRGELTTVFQFDHISFGRSNKYTPAPFSYEQIRDCLVKWQYFAQENNLLYVLFTDNHDQPFYLSRLGNDKELRYECATTFATMFYTLKGIPFIYQGQEFGSVNSFYKNISYFNDVETINYFNEQKDKKDISHLINEINYGSRDNTRRPLAWTRDKNTNFGFSSGTPWIEMPSRAEEINLENDLKNSKSIFAFYRKLLALRKQSDALRHGTFKDITAGEKDCFIFERELDKEKFTVVINFTKKKKLSVVKELKKRAQILLCNYDSLSIFNNLRPFEIIVFYENCK